MTAVSVPVVLDPDDVRAELDPTRGVREWLVVGAAASAPVLFTLSNVLLPDLSGSTAHVVAHLPAVAGRLIAVKLLYAVASLLFLPLVSVLLRPNVRRGSWLRLSGGVLVVVGVASNAFGEIADGYTAWGAVRAHVDAASQVRLLDQLGNGAVTLPISFLAIPVFSVGVLVLMVGLLRSRSVPPWMPWLVIVGAVLAVPAGVGVTALLGIVYSAGLVALVLYLARQRS